MPATLKAIFSIVATILTFYLFIPYIFSILKGTTKPHVFSWIIWGFGTVVVAFAQFAGGSGLGAVPIGISGLISCYIAWLAYQKRTDTDITTTDWYFLIAALSALPLWIITADPLWAVVILTTVDLLGFGPTIRKAYRNPYLENTTFFALFGVRNLLVVLALEHYSLTTALFPAAVGIACFFLTLMLLLRRKQVST